jgi:hypothetical protein
MIAASYWSLLAPAIEMAEQSGEYGTVRWTLSSLGSGSIAATNEAPSAPHEGQLAVLPVAIGFLLGCCFVYGAELLLPFMVGQPHPPSFLPGHWPQHEFGLQGAPGDMLAIIQARDPKEPTRAHTGTTAAWGPVAATRSLASSQHTSGQNRCPRWL